MSFYYNYTSQITWALRYRLMQTKTIPKQEIQQVFTTKRGLYEFLTVELDYFLPPMEFVSIEWLREKWAGNKKVVKNKDAVLASSPHVQGMRIEDLTNFLEEHKRQEYLPGLSRNGKKPKYERAWLLTICASLQTADFKNIRKVALAERKDRVLANTHSQVVTITEIAEALKQSSFVSSGRGRAAALLSGPTTKKRRLNEITGGVAAMEQISTNQLPNPEIRELRGVIAQLKGENELIKAQLVEQGIKMLQFNI